MPGLQKLDHPLSIVFMGVKRILALLLSLSHTYASIENVNNGQTQSDNLSVKIQKDKRKVLEEAIVNVLENANKDVIDTNGYRFYKYKDRIMLYHASIKDS